MIRGQLFFLVAGVAAESARGSELAELVAHHVLRHVDGDELVAVMHGEGVADEIGRNHGGAAPGLDDALFPAFVHCGHLLLKLDADKWSFFKRTTHTCLN